MPDNLLGDKYYFISPWKCLEITGPDSVDFLNRLLTIDVRQLALGRGSWAFLLDHRGRVAEALFLLRVTEQEFMAISETGVESLHDSLELFFFSESLSLTIHQQYQCMYLTTEPEDEDSVTAYPIDLFGLASEYLLVVDQQRLDNLVVTLDQQGYTGLNQDHFDHLRLSSNGALPSREYQEVSPLDVSLKGITEGKGCYPGQEVIERTLALGKPAKVTIHAKVIGPLADLQSVYTEWINGAQLSVVDHEDSSKSFGRLTSIVWPILDHGYEDLVDQDGELIALAQVKKSIDQATIKYIAVNETTYTHLKIKFNEGH